MTAEPSARSVRHPFVGGVDPDYRGADIVALSVVGPCTACGGDLVAPQHVARDDTYAVTVEVKRDV